MMLVLQTLLIISFSHPLPPKFRNFGSELNIADHSKSRRELFWDDISKAANQIAGGVGDVVEDAEKSL